MGLLWSTWARLPPVVLGPSILSKGVEIGLTATQLGLVCAQTMPRLQEHAYGGQNCFRWIAAGRYDNNKIK